MSDLLNQASLVMVPSGYKEDTVYSVVPSDGSGDLSFTRASNGTRVNSAGLVEVVAWNLLQQSETFDNAYWSKAQVTVSANATTAPNGTTTADKIISSAVNDEHVIYYFESNILSQVVTMSAYVKKADYRYAVLRSFTNGGYQISVFDLDNGIVSSQVLGASTIENVGNGWYRISTTFTAPAGTYGVQYGFSATPTYSYLGNGTSGNFLWGAQLNIGSTAKPYFPTTDRLNVPRLTYQNGGGGCPSLLLEKQSTNLVTYSEQFDNAGWVKGDTTVTANATTSPDGTINADLLIDNSTNDLHYCAQNVSTSAGSHTFSFYAKANTLSHCGIRLYDGSIYDSAIFNLSNGTKGSGDGEIESVGNGWYRVSLTKTLITATTYFNIFLSNGTTYTYSGSGQSIYIWGAQYEASSYKTSLINTTSSSATRVADVCTKNGIGALIGTNFTIFFDGFAAIGGDYNRYIVLKGTGGTYANFIALEDNPPKKIAVNVLNNSSAPIFSTLSGTLTTGQRIKMALRCKNNDFAFYINGALIGSQASGSVPTTADLYLGYYTDYPENGNKINQAVIFNTGLSNSDLIALTTI